MERTPLNLILDKNYLLEKINSLEEKIVEDKFVRFTFVENDNEINIFFNKKNYNLIGWQTEDLYQNLVIFYIFDLEKNKKISKDLFKLPN